MPLVFNTNYANNFPQNAMAAVQRAMNTWSAALNSNSQIDVNAIWGTILPGFSAVCIPNAIENYQNPQNPPLNNVWYPSALADALAGVDLQPNDEDFTIFFAAANWNLGPGNPGHGEYDLESVALHEIAHGLGMVGIYWATGWPWVGNYGDNQLIAAATNLINNSGQGQNLGFQLPANLNGHPSIYGLHIQDANGNYLTDPQQYPNLPSQQLGAELIGGNVFFDLNPRVMVYAPNPFAPFTSIDHLNIPGSLMQPHIAPGVRIRAIDQPVLDVMHALGWQ
jgi:hypothetical protein